MAGPAGLRRGPAFERDGGAIDANAELLALGVSNAGASLLHGFPVSSSASRTAIARTAGARTQAYSLTALATVLAVEVDFTALDAVEAVRDELSRRGIIVGLARVKQDLLDDLRAFGLAQKIGEQRIFPTLPTAVEAYQEWVTRHPQPGPDV